ncbi:cytochrome P450 4C1-like [Choristoneura fumiferana]|uniref:cytochrome P450 4C1-like n=1 Tax=Choristoneura fumiferana TaxID=7141 RepID=UPI003D15ECAD
MSWHLLLMLVAIVTTLPLVFWLHWRWRNRRLLELAASVPGPPALPVLGNALLFMASPNEQLKLIGELMKDYGEYVRFWLGPDLNIGVENPEDIKLLLSSNKVNQKGPVYEHLKSVIGSGILTGGKVWRNHRKIITPSYNKKSVAHFAKVFNMESAGLVQALSKKDPSKTFDIYWDIVNCTTQCVCQTLMGLSKDDSRSLKYLDEVVRITHSLYSSLFAKMTRWWLQIPLIFWITGEKKKVEYYSNVVHNLCAEIFEKRRKALARGEGVEDHARGIVDRLILSGELTELEIRQETFTLFTTSQEASAKIASAVLLFLAHMPEWQDKVYNEIKAFISPDDEIMTENQLNRLQYLDMVYKEVLRYLSIAALVQRTVEEEITIDSGRITLPVGTSLAIPIHILHRNPKYWDEPNKVKPERFLPENVKKRNPNAFVPFSLGPMDCLGRVYATVMIKTIVVRALTHLRFEADGRLEDLEVQVAISVKFAAGYNLRVSPRKSKSSRTHTVA